MKYQSVEAAFEGAVGVGFRVRWFYRMKDGGVEQDRWYEVPHNDPALVYRWGSQAPAEALGPYLQLGGRLFLLNHSWPSELLAHVVSTGTFAQAVPVEVFQCLLGTTLTAQLKVLGALR